MIKIKLIILCECVECCIQHVLPKNPFNRCAKCLLAGAMWEPIKHCSIRREKLQNIKVNSVFTLLYRQWLGQRRIWRWVRGISWPPGPIWWIKWS